MKIFDRRRLRTCLSILLVVVCLLTSFLFVNINSSAQEEMGVNREETGFYILDEEGNPVMVEIPQEGVMSRLRSRMVSLLSMEEELPNARSTQIGVLRFKSSASGVVNYTEVDTGRAGYFNCYSAGDAAYIRTEGDYFVCKLSGVLMKVHKDNVKVFSTFENCGANEISYYKVDNGYLMHYYTYYNGNNLAITSTRVGYKPTYLIAGTKYYSYDGHYFYTNFGRMIQDYRSNIYSNAVNASSPYYNYYQYLSFHTTTPFTAAQYNTYITQNKKNSIMATAGSSFVAAQNQYTVNALLMFGIAINESGWGTSTIAVEKNNLFGWNAVDSSPGQSANYFASVEQCIKEYAYEIIHVGYLDSVTDARYRGPHVGDKHSGLNVKYASDPYWGEKAAGRGYYFDTAKIDYGRYTIGIAKSGRINFYKEANTSSTCLYKSSIKDSTKDSEKVYDFPVTILGKVTGSGGKEFYKVISDMTLKSDRSGQNLYGIYSASRDYAYVPASDIQIVFDGSTNITPPSQPDTGGQGKTHAQVLSALNVVNSGNYLTGFTYGGDISTTIAKIKALDSSIGVVAKKANGTQVTSGVIATGMTISITTSGSAVNYTLVIRGDVNGDGKHTALDYVKLRNYLDKKSTLSGAYLKSTDTNKDGKTSAVDYVKLRNRLDNKSTIVQ